MKKTIFLILLATVFQTTLHAQELVLPAEADVWGPPQTILLNDGGKVQLRTMFIKHYGTTCVFKIEFANLGAKPVKETVQLINKDGIYSHWASDLRLAVNEVATYQMEKRECAVIFGKKKQKNITKCAECKPTIRFLKKN